MTEVCQSMIGTEEVKRKIVAQFLAKDLAAKLLVGRKVRRHFAASQRHSTANQRHFTAILPPIPPQPLAPHCPLRHHRCPNALPHRGPGLISAAAASGFGFAAA